VPNVPIPNTQKSLVSGATGGYRSSDPLEAGAAEAAEAEVEAEPVTLAAAELADDVFLQAFQEQLDQELL